MRLPRMIFALVRGAAVTEVWTISSCVIALPINPLNSSHLLSRLSDVLTGVHSATHTKYQAFEMPGYQKNHRVTDTTQRLADETQGPWLSCSSGGQPRWGGCPWDSSDGLWCWCLRSWMEPLSVDDNGSRDALTEIPRCFEPWLTPTLTGITSTCLSKICWSSCVKSLRCLNRWLEVLNRLW